MAVLTNTNWFANAIVGQPMAGADINIYDVNSNPKLAVGFGFTRSDGNKYRYCSFGENVRGGWAVGPVRSDGCATQAATLTCGNTHTALFGEIPSNQVGSHYIRVTSLSASAQQYNGGYVSIYTGPGAGCTYRVKNTLAAPISGSADDVLELYEPLQIALTTASTIMITMSPYNDLKKSINGSSTTLGSQFISGIAVASANSGQFGWIQTHGITSALQGAEVCSGTAAGMVVSSSATPAAIASLQIENVNVGTGGALLTTPIIGYYVNPGSAGGYSTIYLTLE